ncbi:hypothetical protein C8Q76DRAFT_791144 [Earliella scabrosa]|nr:hypothetical protein C8Q76DRAFT_791144 [Earliella scabrosa]
MAKITAARDVLLCQDITQVILEYLDPGPMLDNTSSHKNRRERRARQAALRSAAITCRALYQPALNILWRVVDDIKHLLSVLPAFSRSRSHPGTFVFHGKIPVAEWARLERYATCVQLSIIAASPALQHLELDMSAYTRAPEETVHTFIEDLLPLIARLRTLSIFQSPNEDNSPWIWQQTHLQSLTIKHRIVITSSLKKDRLPEDISPELPTLKKLAIKADLSIIVTWMETIRTPNVLSLKVEFSCTGLSSDIQDPLLRIFHMIPSSVADLCISQFDLAGYRSGYLGSSDICGRLLGSLHSHQALKRLSLHFESPLAANITDADLAAITSKWKNLVTLEITYRQDEEGRARVNESGTLPRVQTVAAFATAHPRLERLALPYLSLRAVPHLSEVPAGHALDYLSIHDLPPGASVAQLGRVLDRMFPKLALPEDVVVTGARGNELQLLLIGLQTGRLCAQGGV